MGNIYLYGEIGWSINAKDFIDKLDSIPKDETVNLFINSPGGDVMEGLAMFNALQRRKSNLKTYIDGLAYSAASWAALAADPENRFMSKASMFGIHKASSFAGGNTNDLEKAIEWLNTIDEIQLFIYTEASGLSEDLIKEIMDNDLPLSFKESEAFGFKSYEPEKIAALFKINNMENGKSWLDKLADLTKAAKEEPTKEVKIEAEKEVKETAKLEDNPAKALVSEMVLKSDFLAFKKSIEPLFDALLDYIKVAPTLDDMEKLARTSAKESLDRVLQSIKSEGIVPTKAEADFRDLPEDQIPKDLKADKESFKETMFNKK